MSNIHLLYKIRMSGFESNPECESEALEPLNPLPAVLTSISLSLFLVFHFQFSKRIPLVHLPLPSRTNFPRVSY